MANKSPDGMSVARIAGRLLAGFVRFVDRTSKVTAEPDGIIERLRGDHPCIVGLWHGQFMMASMHRPDVPVAAMVARHGDAELIGATMHNLGVELVRGAGAGSRKKDRGGASALRAALQCLSSGKSFVMTADVPPGPARRCGDGIITLARMSGRPIVPLAVASSRSIVLDTWSRLTINLPFSKLAFVYGEPIFVPRDATAEQLEDLRLAFEQALNAATRRAYAIAGADLARTTPRSVDPSIPPAKPGLTLRAYRGLTRMLSPLAPVILARRAKQGKEDPKRQPERLGFAKPARPDGPLAWIHAASVGELNAVLPLIGRLGDARPDLKFLVTTGTVTSAGLAAARLGSHAIHQFVPVDTPQAVRRFLDHWQPSIAVFTESEIWPNLVLATSERRIPLALVNARMSARSRRRWRGRSRIAKQLFGRFTLVLAQNGALARLFSQLGAPKTVDAGNLKIDAPPPPVDTAELARLRLMIGGRPLFVAASTHEGEERIIAVAHTKLRERLPGLLTIIAPRHPERGPSVVADLRAAGLNVAQRSIKEDPVPDSDIYVADTIGELGLFYSLGSVVFLGGSLVERGGQNPIEAIRLGCAVVSGPSRHNFADIYRSLVEASGVATITSADDLADTVFLLLTDEALQKTALRAANQVLTAQGGALEKTVAALLPLLPAMSTPSLASTDAPKVVAAEPLEQELRRAIS
jgi:3-deoxy-D-manno-octulosonic-acid transferase